MRVTVADSGLCCRAESPWCNRNGRLGIKHQVILTYLCDVFHELIISLVCWLSQLWRYIVYNYDNHHGISLNTFPGHFRPLGASDDPLLCGHIGWMLWPCHPTVWWLSAGPCHWLHLHNQSPCSQKNTAFPFWIFILFFYLCYTCIFSCMYSSVFLFGILSKLNPIQVNKKLKCSDDSHSKCRIQLPSVCHSFVFPFHLYVNELMTSKPQACGWAHEVLLYLYFELE